MNNVDMRIKERKQQKLEVAGKSEGHSVQGCQL